MRLFDAHAVALGFSGIADGAGFLALANFIEAKDRKAKHLNTARVARGSIEEVQAFQPLSLGGM